MMTVRDMVKKYESLGFKEAHTKGSWKTKSMTIIMINEKLETIAIKGFKSNNEWENRNDDFMFDSIVPSNKLSKGLKETVEEIKEIIESNMRYRGLTFISSLARAVFQ